jgi:hypothetical protein
MWNKIKKFFKPWPKTLRFEVRNGDCKLLAVKEVKVYSWNEVMTIGAEFADEVMFFYPGHEADEVYWRYEEVD